MTVEIIADGIHLPKPLLQFVYKFKGADKTALCTDAMRGAGMPDGESILGSLTNGQKVIIEDGVAKLPDRSALPPPAFCMWIPKRVLWRKVKMPTSSSSTIKLT